jgi:hypothetical protein
MQIRLIIVHGPVKGGWRKKIGVYQQGKFCFYRTLTHTPPVINEKSVRE